MGPARLVQRTTDGELASAGTPYIVYAATLAAGSDTATLELRDGGASGTVLLTLRAPANTTATAQFPCGVVFSSGVYVDLSGTGPAAAVAFS
jgi:hypothetical protein